jgi:putative transposase
MEGVEISEPDKITRCISNRLKLPNHKMIIVDSLCYHSKNIYNTGIYFCRHWYILVGLIISHYIANYKEYFDLFSLSDKYIILSKILSFDPNLSITEYLDLCHQIVDSLAFYELIDFKDLGELHPNLNELLEKKLSSMERPKTKRQPRSQTAPFDIASFVLGLEKIKCDIIFYKDPENFNTYMDDLILVYKNRPPPVKKVKKVKKVKNVDDEPDNGDKTQKPNIIPPSFIGSVLNYVYVKHITQKDSPIGSQCLQQTLKKVDEAYKSFWGLLRTNTNHKVNLPEYKRKNDRYSVIFQNNSFQFKTQNRRNYIDLSLGNDIIYNDEVVYINQQRTKYVTKCFLKTCPSYPTRQKGYNIHYDNRWYSIQKDDTNIRKSKILRIDIGKHGKQKKEDICQIEMVPVYNGIFYNIRICYKCRDNMLNIVQYDRQKNDPKINDPDYEMVIPKDGNGIINMVHITTKQVSTLVKPEILSADLGNKNFVTMGKCRDVSHPIIFSGDYLVYINNKFNKKIDERKGFIKKEYNLNTDIVIQKLYQKRHDIIMDEMHKISTAIINYAKENNVGTIVFGYNIGWKQHSQMGKVNNRKFHDIPYRKFLDMVFYKGQDNGIVIKEINEAYTSICDALSGEEIGFHQNYRGKRVKRGLFQSGIGIKINADVNGQMNIMRKYLINHRGFGEEEYVERLMEEMEKVKRPKMIKHNKINKLAEELRREYTERK